MRLGPFGKVPHRSRLREAVFGLLAGCAAFATGSLIATPLGATTFTSTSPSGTALPSVYPEAGGVAMILYGALVIAFGAADRTLLKRLMRR